ncbi:MAG: acetylornithine/succinylornithine family transaminase [Aquimonas sp.]|jgi:acetylornithine/N-succinyldiaminopimelate aminotransferase|nr:acetylornithine/succinylornithine family transaminase [Xanthomonadales bacterium]MCC6507227.1 acetylornithine/succinylornithine family transaminase [Aquimonas sp.]
MSESSAQCVALAQQLFVPTYLPRAIILERGEGSRVWDRDGRDYIDLAAGIAVNALGHANPLLQKVLSEQAAKLWHTSNVFLSEPPIRLAEALLMTAPFADRVFLCNSGAEANEAAIKLARRHASQQGRDPDHRVILTFRGSFHGRTLATVTATAQPKYQAGFEPLPGGFRYGELNCIDQLDGVMTEDVCAVLVEPIQGEGGVVPCAPGFLAELRLRCDRIGALLILDEIQCGMGRTGKLFAHQWENVRADVVTLAKALGAGFPIGAMLVGPVASKVLDFGSHGTTFGGNPLAAAVALAALREISSAVVLDNVIHREQQFRAGLQQLNKEFELFAEVRGRGLMLGAQLAPAYSGRAAGLLDAAAAERLLLLQAGPDVLRLVPALNITEDETAEGMARLRSAILRWR